MEIREFLNTKEGFTEIIEIDENSIKENYNDIARCEEAQNKRIQLYDYDNLSVIRSLREDIASDSLELVFAKYSLGIHVEEIKKDYIVALNEMSKAWEGKDIEDFSYNESEPFYSTDEYWLVLQMIALGILFEVTDEEVFKIIKIRDKVPAQDILLDYLCSFFDNRNYLCVQATGNNYNGLVNLVKEIVTDNADLLMKSYLNTQWFKDYKRQGFMTSHNSNYNIHIGYWSFESGAIMKVLKADDTILRNQQFYPYDLVHWNKNDKGILL